MPVPKAAAFICGCNEPVESPPRILRRIPYPVEPFGFKLGMRDLAPPMLQREGNSFWQQPGLFGEVNDRPPDYHQYLHTVGFRSKSREAHPQGLSLNCTGAGVGLVTVLFKALWRMKDRATVSCRGILCKAHDESCQERTICTISPQGPKRC